MLTTRMAYRRYTAVPDDDTANEKELTISEVGQIGAANVQIIRAGKVVSSDPAITISGNKIKVADGSSYALTTGDILHILVHEGA